MNKYRIIFSKKMASAIFSLLFKYIPVYLFSLTCKRKEQLWLIAERKDDARDNGIILFRYLRKTHPEINVYYAINFKSIDYQKVKHLGNFINWGSYRHYYFYFVSTILCGTGFDICSPNSYESAMMKKLLPTKAKRVFLQHGITKDALPQAVKSKLGVQLFVCGAFPEYEYISKHFGYSNNEVKYLGFARFDNLENTISKNLILYMPTWRLWLNNSNFEESNYYSGIVSFISSKALQNILDEYNAEFIFFIHPAIRDKKNHFMQFNTNRIHIFNNNDIDLQVLLKSSKLLITDFSSVFFDFAYLGKPLIYYQFDREEFRKKHYPTGYFDYERDGFGPVVDNFNSLIDNIKIIVKNNWLIGDIYSRRIDRFFPYRDKNNCKRHYEELCKLDGLKIQ